MVHSEGPELGCVCPECGARCRACLGTDTVIPREHLREALARQLDREPFTGFVTPGEHKEDDDRFRG